VRLLLESLEEPVSGLSANTLEYLVLGMSLAYVIAAFYEYRYRKSLLGQVLGLALKIIPYFEAKLRAYRERARVKERNDRLL
jgi:hypothetical protein